MAHWRRALLINLNVGACSKMRKTEVKEKEAKQVSFDIKNKVCEVWWAFLQIVVGFG